MRVLGRIAVNPDHERLDQLRAGQGEIANHIIDEFAAGRLSRRDFLRRGTVVGLSLPILGGVLAACGSSSTSSTKTGGGRGTGPPPAAIKAGAPPSTTPPHPPH